MGGVWKACAQVSASKRVSECAMRYLQSTLARIPGLLHRETLRPRDVAFVEAFSSPSGCVAQTLGHVEYLLIRRDRAIRTGSKLGLVLRVSLTGRVRIRLLATRVRQLITCGGPITYTRTTTASTAIGAIYHGQT